MNRIDDLKRRAALTHDPMLRGGLYQEAADLERDEREGSHLKGMESD